jgi:hypothetical protein
LSQGLEATEERLGDMAVLDAGRLSKLFRDRANLSSQAQRAQMEAGSLTHEYNRLVQQANRASGASSARQRLEGQAQRKGRESEQAHKECEAILRRLHDKEIEIADLIDALLAAAQPLLSADTARKVDEHLAGINQQLRRIDEHVTPIAPALNRLLRTIDEQGEFAREVTDTQSGDATSEFAELKSALRLQAVKIEASRTAADSATVAVRETLKEIRREVRSLVGAAEPIVQEGWDPETPHIDEARSPDLAVETLAALPENVTVLLFASEPRDKPPVYLDKEIREITEKIYAAKFGHRINMQSSLATQVFDVIPNFNRHQPHMVQFSGHGTSEGVLMMGPRDRSEPLAAHRLIQMFKWTGDQLRIVFFNICESEEHARAAAGIVEASIGMRGQIQDMSARTFAASLYSGLAFGNSLQSSFQQACTTIDDLPDRAAPQLFFRDGIDPHKVVLVRPGS